MYVQIGKILFTKILLFSIIFTIFNKLIVIKKYFKFILVLTKHKNFHIFILLYCKKIHLRHSFKCNLITTFSQITSKPREKYKI